MTTALRVRAATCRTALAGEGPNGPAVVIGLAMPGVQSETHHGVGTGVMLAQAVSITSSGLTTRIQIRQMP